MVLRAEGTKTEPAFASTLGLNSNPYRVMNDLLGASDTALVALLTTESFVLQERETQELIDPHQCR